MNRSPPPSPAADVRPARRRRFRFLAIAVALIPFAVGELLCRAVGWGTPSQTMDVFVDFAGVRPLFILNDDGTRFEIPPVRQPFFKPDHFAATKGASEFRIFCLGGSTVQGNPYSIETSFTTWLELNLRAADPKVEWQVVNCGGISYASYRLAPILQECLEYSPDLFVLYLGDNEFLEARSYEHLKQRGRWFGSARSILARSHLFNVFQSSWLTAIANNSGMQPSTRLPEEVDALLDYRGGLEEYRRDDEWREEVVRHFRATLDQMLATANERGVPVLLVDPVCNLKDCAPFKAQFSEFINDETRQRCAELITASQRPECSREDRTMLLQQATELDARHAGHQFLLGRALLENGRHEEAFAAFLRAKEEDVCPLRVIEPTRQAIYQAAEEAGISIVPVWEKFISNSPEHIPGDELLLDHLHPTISGQQMIAQLLIETMASKGWVSLRSEYHDEQRRLYEAHLSTLDAPYYARGKEHLEGLRLWAQGRVKKLRDESKDKATR